jgi:phosphopantothenoylcysteine synthetase/decarboxylase
VAAEESASGRENPYSDDCRAILELAGMVNSSDVRSDLIILAAAYRRLANVAAAKKSMREPAGIDPDVRCSRFLQDAFREESADRPPR